MENQEKLNKISKYESAFNTANFLASEGNYKLAFQVTRSALEKIYLEEETAPVRSSENDKEMRDLEVRLTQKYINFRSKLEGKNRPYWKTFLNTSIICGIISIAIMITVSIVVLQTESVINKPIAKFMSVIQDTVRTELPPITNEIRAQIPFIAQKVRDEIPKMSKNLVKIIDERITRVIENETEKVIIKILPEIVEEKLKKITEQRKK